MASRIQLSTTPHPDGPDLWLDVEHAGKLMHAAGLRSRISMTWCKKHHIEVSPSGHVYRVSLELFINRELYGER